MRSPTSSSAPAASGRAALRGLVAALVALGGLVLAAGPAAAHGVGGPSASNWLSRTTSVPAELDGVQVAIDRVGEQLRATNRTDRELLVLGYQGEPYLRVGPGGTFENERSPATYLNRDLEADVEVPASADPKAEPVWRKASSSRTAAWHDHRTHWMGAQDPPAVRRAPDRRHVVYPDWRVPVRLGDRDAVVRGELVWVPGPSPAPWLAGAAALAVAAGALGLLRRGWARAIAAATALGVVVDVLHVVASALAEEGTAGERAVRVLVGAGVPSLVGWAAAGIAVRLLLQGRTDGLFASAVAGVVLLLTGGVGDLADLSRSQVPSAAGATVARLLVVASLGLGLGLLVASVLGIRRHHEPTAGADDRPPGRTLEGSIGATAGDA